MADDSRESSPDSLFVPQNDHYTNDHATRRSRTAGTLALPPRTATRPRFAGDGLDFRRPIMSNDGGTVEGAASRGHEVIDLTDESQEDAAPEPNQQAATASSSRAQRPPRFGRNIIDIESEEEDEHRSEASHEQAPTMTEFIPPRDQRNLYAHHPRFSVLRRPSRHTTSNSANMADLEFVSERPRSRPQSASRSQTPAIPAPRSLTPYPTGVGEPIDLTGDDDEVVHLHTEPRAADNLVRPGTTAGSGTRSFLADIVENMGGGNRLAQRVRGLFGEIDMAEQQELHDQLREQQRLVRQEVVNQQRMARRAQAAAHRGARVGNMPGLHIAFDYEPAAFDLGIIEGNRPPTPPYEAPPPAAAGFTRSPAEDEVVVCPNCGDELAMGDSDEKQQVHVIKKCGHVSSSP